MPDPDLPRHRTSALRIALISGSAILLVVAAACLILAATGGKVSDLPGWIEALATLAAVVAVIVAWIQLSDGREATKAQTEQAAQAALDQARPYVLVGVARSPVSLHFIDLVVENVGAGPAYDVEIAVDPPLRRAKVSGMELAEARLFRKPIKMMPPRYEMRSFYDNALDRKDEPDLPDFHEVTIRYHDGRGHDWTEHLTLDLTLPQGLLFTEEYNIHHLAKAVREIEKHIKSSPLTKGQVEATVESRIERTERKRHEYDQQIAEHDALVARFRPPVPASDDTDAPEDNA